MPAMTTGTTGSGVLTPAAYGASASGAVFVPEVWSRDIQEARKNKLVMEGLVSTRYQNDLRYGDTVHITAISEMTADAMTPGTALVPVAPNETEQTLVIDRYYGKAIEIHEVLKKQAFTDLRAPYTRELGYAIAKAMDGTLLDQYANAATKRTAIATMTFAEIVEGHAVLDIANVPMEDRALVINGRILADLRKLPEFTAYDQTGREGVRETRIGIVGDIYGTPVYVTNAVKSADATPAYQALLFHKDAIASVIQLRPDVETDRDILKKTDIMSVSALWGVKTVRPDHAVVLRRTV